MLKRIRYLRWYYWGRWGIKKKINSKLGKGEKIKIIIGSGKYYGLEQDWIYTDLPHFNILNTNDWKYFFEKNQINNLLAEHVLEHLTEEETIKLMKLSFDYLKIGGIFRIAVPDGYHTDSNYIESVKPGGIGPGSDDHKILWNYQTLVNVASAQNFTITLLEYYNEDGKFEINEYSFSDGFIQRSKKNNFSWEVIDNYTSLIIDLKKNQ